MKSLVIGMALALGLAVPALAQSTQKAQGGQKAQQDQKATASFIDQKGKTIGTATVTQMPNGVLIALDLKGVPRGEHAFHIHENGECDPSGEFKSAGGHFNPGNKPHGYENPDGPHAGDMPNQFVGEDGVLNANVFNPNVTLGSGLNSLFASGTVGSGADAGGDGKALVLHAKADDYESQPSGDAGGRIACAVIKKQ